MSRKLGRVAAPQRRPDLTQTLVTVVGQIHPPALLVALRARRVSPSDRGAAKWSNTVTASLLIGGRRTTASRRAGRDEHEASNIITQMTRDKQTKRQLCMMELCRCYEFGKLGIMLMIKLLF